MVGFLIMSAKLATQGLYDVIMSVHDVTSKILLLKLKYSVDVAMWLKCSNCSISIREVSRTSFL